MDNNIDLRDALSYIRPSDLDYQDWISVGMALKEADYPVDVWDEWSRQDERYHHGECESKWRGFHGAPDPVTAGTIVHMARENGWKPTMQHTNEPGRELAWEDEIGGGDSNVPAKPTGSSAASQLITYLETLFEASENVGYVTASWEKDGKYLPSKGCYDRTAGQLIEQLNKCGGDIGGVIGDCNPKAGAWIRFNPLDGNGVKNDNVTEYRYALVESDSMSLNEQREKIEQMQLPVAALVYSGGKSVHAIVRVEAANHEEYRKRVDYLYGICRKYGMDIDRQNSNPSRLSRMPGIMRNGKEQTLIATNIGLKSWDEWVEYMETINDDMPDLESLSGVWGNIPELAPELIAGVLRQGHKMLLAGPSKAAKSFSLIELAISIAEGIPWMGFKCAKGKVLYVNLELDRVSCLHRFRDVYMAANIPPNSLQNIDIWNLRGKSLPMNLLAPKLIRRAMNQNYLAIIIDPIYKVITGDENSAEQMAKFCNQFDKVCTELGCAVVYCHHHSKGAQGGKRSMDRASGSGVFARDPDAMLDLIELDINEDLRKQLKNNAACDLCRAQLEAIGKVDEVGQDDLLSRRAALEACQELLSDWRYNKLLKDIENADGAVRARTAWRIEGTLREFPKFPPVNIWFDYPIHRTDESGVLNDIKPEDETPSWRRNFQRSGKRNKSPEERKKERAASIATAFDACCMEGDSVQISELCEYLGKSEKTVRRQLKEHGEFWIDEGKCGKK